jgi:hypothetical protein
MTSILGKSVADQYVGTLSEMKMASRVARKLLGQPEPKPEPPPNAHSSIAEVAAYYTAEIDRNYDPEWPDQRDVVWIGAQLAQEVVAQAKDLTIYWRYGCEHGSKRKMASYVAQNLERFSGYAEPALYAAEKEYDCLGELRGSYEKIKKQAHSKLADIEVLFSAHRLLAVKPKLSQIRKQMATPLQALLDDLASNLQRWSDLFPQDSSKLPNRR